jgi:hypothetical protein
MAPFLLLLINLKYYIFLSSSSSACGKVEKSFNLLKRQTLPLHRLCGKPVENLTACGKKQSF